MKKDPTASSSQVASRSSRGLAVLAHASPLFGMFVVPAVLMVWPGRTDPFVRTNAKVAFDFQVSAFVGFVTLGVLVVVTKAFALVQALLFGGYLVAFVVFWVMVAFAGRQAWSGNVGRYSASARILQRLPGD